MSKSNKTEAKTEAKKEVKKEAKKELTQDAMEARLHKHINHHSELSRLEREHQAELNRLHSEQEAKERDEKGRIAAACVKRSRRRKWCRVRNCLIATLIIFALFHAETAGLISTKLAAPLIAIGLYYVLLCIPGIYRESAKLNRLKGWVSNERSR